MEWAPGTGSKQEIYGDWGKGKKETERCNPQIGLGLTGGKVKLTRAKTKSNESILTLFLFFIFTTTYHYY